MEESNTRKSRRTGSLQQKAGNWYAVLTVDGPDGKPARKWQNLRTHHKSTAKRLLARLLKSPESEIEQAVERQETYAELADRVATKRRDAGVADTRSEELRERIDILPAIGPIAVNEITPDDIEAIFEAARDRGKSLSHLRQLRQVMRTRFTVAMREKAISTMPTDLVEMPRVKVDNRERAVLTDQELQQYLSWEHPDPTYRLGVLERQTMGAVSRIFGGIRSGDVHVLRWDQIDAPNFKIGTAPRAKTAKPQRIAIPAALRPILLQWWNEAKDEEGKKPTTGLVFPCLRGTDAGVGPKQGVSHAEALRRDLVRVFGLETWNAAKRRFEETEGREMTERERELLTETDLTRPVDFHSFRRGFVQGLADAHVTAQEAQRLAGHADLGAHERYLRSSRNVLTIPVAALPKLEVEAISTLGSQLSDLNRRPAVYEFSLADCTELHRMECACNSTVSGPNILHRAAPARTKTKVWTKMETMTAVIWTMPDRRRDDRVSTDREQLILQRPPPLTAWSPVPQGLGIT